MWFFAILVCGFTSVQAQDKEDLSAIKVYGSLRFRLAEFDGNYEVQDNLSRVGVLVSHENAHGFTVLGCGEWQVNLVDNSREFNLESASREFSRLEFEGDPQESFITRQGYVGLSYLRFGTVTFGKQWGAYYDVAEYTDWFNVFGAEATGTYNAGTAGGVTGTGRPEKAVIYRNHVENLQVAAQIQLKGETTHDVDSYGFSARYGFDFGLSLGVAHNLEKVDEASLSLLGLNEDPRATVMGVKYENGPFYAAFTYTNQDNNETVNVGDTTVVFDGTGLEFYAHYNVTESLRLTTGFNSLDPEELDPRVDEDFEIKYGVVGAQYNFTESAFAFAEAKLNAATDQYGEDDYDVFMFGIRVDFSLSK
jgi:predicted porin